MGTPNALARRAHHVQVGHGGLHQDHVRAFFEVEVDLAHGLAQVGAVHLVGLAVAELRRGVGRLAEGPVEGRRELRRVAEDGRLRAAFARRARARMAATRPSIMSLGATTSAPALAWLTAVRASSSSVGSLSTSKPSRLSITTPQWPWLVYSHRQTSAMSTSFFAAADLLERAQRLLHDAVFFPCAGALLVFGLRQAEEQQPAQAQLRGLFGFAHRFVHGEVEDAGHGADRVRTPSPGQMKQRVDQVAGLENCLAHQRPHGLAAPQPAHPHLRETHG